MAETLKSITNRIHWSLLIKPLAFAAAWYWLPWWAFFCVALILYFFPALPHSPALPAFWALVALSYFLHPTPLYAALYAVLFCLVVGIRELILIDRRRAYHILALGVTALGLFLYATMLGVRGDASALPELAFGAAAYYFLLAESFGRMSAALMTFLMLELLGIVALLPFNVFYMTAFAFMSSAFLMDSAERMRSDERNPAHVFFGFAIFFLFVVFILVSNPWRP